MITFLKKINIGDKLKIRREEYLVKGMGRYYIDYEPDSFYVKMFLNDDRILMYMEKEDIWMFCKHEDLVEYDFPAPDEIVYNNQKFNIVDRGYQYVTNIFFGEPERRSGVL